MVGTPPVSGRVAGAQQPPAGLEQRIMAALARGALIRHTVLARLRGGQRVQDRRPDRGIVVGEHARPGPSRRAGPCRGRSAGCGTAAHPAVRRRPDPPSPAAARRSPPAAARRTGGPARPGTPPPDRPPQDSPRPESSHSHELITRACAGEIAPVPLRGGDPAEHRRQRLPGQIPPRPQLTRRPHPRLRLRRRDPRQLPQQIRQSTPARTPPPAHARPTPPTARDRPPPTAAAGPPPRRTRRRARGRQASSHQRQAADRPQCATAPPPPSWPSCMHQD